MDIRRLHPLLGHQTLAMTQRYSHLGPKDLREAVGMVAIAGSEARRLRARGAALAGKLHLLAPATRSSNVIVTEEISS